MVTLTRLAGSVFALNSDLIERVDNAPETVITLVDGTEYLVRESLEEVVDRVRSYRGSVIAAASGLDRPQAEPVDESPGLHLVLPHDAASIVPFPTRLV